MYCITSHHLMHARMPQNSAKQWSIRLQFSAESNDQPPRRNLGKDWFYDHRLWHHTDWGWLQGWWSVAGLTLAGDVTLLRCVGTSIPSWWKVITWRLERAAGESWRLEATNVTDLGEFSYFYCLVTSWNPFDFDLAVTWLGAPCFVQVVYIELNF